uniref:Uncharacterized protein n=1 Tax=Arundo donax TaxID=35708 RepID=A0A0A9HHJ3_ARUDO
MAVWHTQQTNYLARVLCYPNFSALQAYLGKNQRRYRGTENLPSCNNEEISGMYQALIVHVSPQCTSAARDLGHRISLYADDVVLFIRPTPTDMEVTNGILTCSRVQLSLLGARMKTSNWCVIPSRAQLRLSLASTSGFPCLSVSCPRWTFSQSSTEWQTCS